LTANTAQRGRRPWCRCRPAPDRWWSAEMGRARLPNRRPQRAPV